MSQQTVIKREACETCLELLMIEMVETILRSCDSDLELAGYKLENIGFRVGQKLAERYTRERGRFEEKKDSEKDLDIVKYLCKEFWFALFKKNVDNLKTNHRDKYVITDNNFRMLRRFSADTQEATEKSSEKYMHFPRGLIRGALNSLGMECEVRAEVRPMPPPNPKVPITDPKDNYGLACSFTVLAKVSVPLTSQQVTASAPASANASTTQILVSGAGQTPSVQVTVPQN